MIDRFYQQPFPAYDLNEDFFLREHIMDDSSAFYEYYAKPEVAQYILASTPRSEMEAESEIHYCRNLFKAGRGIYWTIARKSDNRMVGAIGLYTNNFHHRAEISYDLAPEYWGKGIMAMAVRAVCQIAFDGDFQRIEAVTMPENTASIQLLLKCGFTHEGLMKKYKQYNNQSHDIEMFSLIKE